jgi:hypothetical protein
MPRAPHGGRNAEEGGSASGPAGDARGERIDSPRKTTPPRVAISTGGGDPEASSVPVAGRSPGSPVLTACLPARRARSGIRGDPHRPTVAGAAAVWRGETRAAPRSRFIDRDGFAADTCGCDCSALVRRRRAKRLAATPIAPRAASGGRGDSRCARLL